MWGEEARQPSFVFLGPLEARIPEGHPLRPIRQMTDEALRTLSPLFAEIYAERGRPSIPPEYLLRALFLQVLYGIPSERKLVEEAFGWMKTVGFLHKLRHRGRAKARWIFQLTAAVYNLVRMRSLLAESTTS